MSKWSCAPFAVALAACLAMPCVASPAHASQDAAKRYFQNGVDLITGAQPNYQDAYYQFQLAYQESARSWKVLGNLGLCALKLERDQEAVQYYEQYLQKGRSEIVAEERAAIEQDLLLLKGNLATVRLSSPVPDAKLTDQRAGSSAPAQPYALVAGTLELKLRAGNHSITAVSGDKRLSWEIVLEPKVIASHQFDFDAPVVTATPVAAAPAAVIAPAKPLPAGSEHGAEPGNGARLGGYAALGVGAVSLGLGGFFLWQSSDRSSKADAAFACDHQPGGCSNAQRSEVRGLEGEAATNKTRGALALGIGGAAVATGVVLLLIAPSSTVESAPHAQLTPWLGYRAAGVTGTF